MKYQLLKKTFNVQVVSKNNDILPIKNKVLVNKNNIVKGTTILKTIKNNILKKKKT